ncbi:MAG: dicarboxylate/amino acid:cation symporter [Polyangiaceae bacterium]|nr:dicarboxylate/amino acid:cation symporter [Polyangiaceae bacterium]
MALHNRILAGLLLGAGVGVSVNAVAGQSPWVDALVRNVTEPLGRMWLAALIMVVVPLIVSTLSLGVVGLGDLRRLGRIGLLTGGCFLTLTVLSTALGLTVMNLVQPGKSLDAATRQRLLETYGDQAKGAMGISTQSFGVELLVRIVPRNPIKAAADGDMLAIIFVALILGVALAGMSEPKREPMLKLLDSLAHVTVAIIELVMKLAPYGVFCLIVSVTARFGFGLLLSLLGYVSVVVGSLVAFQALVYPLAIKLIARRSPAEFLRQAKVVMLTAFSTSSSSATLPTTLRATQQGLGIRSEVAGFVIPLGATMNMNGTSLFEGITVLFLAQVFGVELSLGAQLVVVAMAVLTAVGTAGVPGGSLPLMMMVCAMVGVPMEGIAIVLGVDRILDMCRTVLNVTGDMVTAAIVDRLERGSRG